MDRIEGVYASLRANFLQGPSGRLDRDAVEPSEVDWSRTRLPYFITLRTCSYL